MSLFLHSWVSLNDQCQTQLLASTCTNGVTPTGRTKKTIHFDEQEQEDAIKYRIQSSKRMLDSMRKMDLYSRDNQEIVMEPILTEDEKKVVFVTHDESTFYANDGKSDMRLLEGENHIRKKWPGLSTMVNEFQCPCHGTMMKIEGWTSRTLFKTGGVLTSTWLINWEKMLFLFLKDFILIAKLFFSLMTALIMVHSQMTH